MKTRDDLALTAYAVAHGFTINTQERFGMRFSPDGEPIGALTFVKDTVHVWNPIEPGVAWMVSVFDPVSNTFIRSKHSRFQSLKDALDHALKLDPD